MFVREEIIALKMGQRRLLELDVYLYMCVCCCGVFTCPYTFLLVCPSSCVCMYDTGGVHTYILICIFNPVCLCDDILPVLTSV